MNTKLFLAVDGAVITLSTCFLVHGLYKKVKEAKESYISDEALKDREAALEAEKELDREIVVGGDDEPVMDVVGPRMTLREKIDKEPDIFKDHAEAVDGAMSRVETIVEESEEDELDFNWPMNAWDEMQMDINKDVLFELETKAEEGKIMKYDKDSMEAMAVYIRNHLADVHDKDIRKVLREMFLIPFVPRVESDQIIKSNVIDWRVDFFGDSHWADGENENNCTFAELLLYFAGKLNWDYDKGTGYWVRKLICENGISQSGPDDLRHWCYELQGDILQEGEHYGMFMLTEEEMSKGFGEDLMQQFYDYETKYDAEQEEKTIDYEKYE